MFVALGLSVLLGVGFVAAYPSFKVKGNAEVSDEEIAEMQEFHENIREAIENEDYASWKSLMESQLTEENFSKMVEHHNAMQEKRDLMQRLRDAVESGDTESVEEAREELSESGFQGRLHKSFHKSKGIGF